MINFGSWNKLEQFLPNEYNLEKLVKNAPYYFYQGPDHDMICLRDKNDLFYPSNFYTATTRIHKMEKEIMALDIGDNVVLVDFSAEPRIIHNYTTKWTARLIDVLPPNIQSTMLLAFDKHFNPIKIGVSRAWALYVIGQAMKYVVDEKFQPIQTNVNLFVDFLQFSGVLTHTVYQDDIFKYVEPQCRKDLNSYQVGAVLAIARKAEKRKKNSNFYPPADKEDKKEKPPEEKDSTCDIYFSKILNQIPEVQETTGVILDTDVYTDFGIQRVEILPGKRLLITIDVKKAGYQKEKISEMLGHDQFTVILLNN